MHRKLCGGRLSRIKRSARPPEFFNSVPPGFRRAELFSRGERGAGLISNSAGFISKYGRGDAREEDVQSARGHDPYSAQLRFRPGAFVAR